MCSLRVHVERRASDRLSGLGVVRGQRRRRRGGLDRLIALLTKRSIQGISFRFSPVKKGQICQQHRKLDSHLSNILILQAHFSFKRKKNLDIFQFLLLNVGIYSTKIYKQIQPSTSTRKVQTAQRTQRILVKHPEDNNQRQMKFWVYLEYLCKFTFKNTNGG